MRLNFFKSQDGKQTYFATIQSDAIPVVGETVVLNDPVIAGTDDKGYIVRQRSWNFFGADLSVDVHLDESSGL
ncbi:MAG: hypothetical protein ACAI34_07480 [Verrucomicrobium sp.]